MPDPERVLRERARGVREALPGVRQTIRHNRKGAAMSDTPPDLDCEIGLTTSGKVHIALIHGMQRMSITVDVAHAKGIMSRLAEVLDSTNTKELR
jgi:microsomal dipeptidase-like Zn-dependent dipeptidase